MEQILNHNVATTFNSLVLWKVNLLKVGKKRNINQVDFRQTDKLSFERAERFAGVTLSWQVVIVL